MSMIDDELIEKMNELKLNTNVSNKHSYDEGYDEGYNDGRKEAYTELEEKMKELQKKNEELQEKLEMKDTKIEDNKELNVEKGITFREGYKNRVFEQIKQKCNEKIKDISNLITVNGDTQNKEKISITNVRNVLDDLGFNYTEAGSQQSKDFRDVYTNVKSLSINIEVKKTDNFTVYFNDTLPSKDIYYIIFFTGTKYKKKENILPQLIFINGYDLIKNDFELLMEYDEDIEHLKNKWGRKGSNCKANSFKHFSVYPRPTYKTDIKYLLNSQQSFVLEGGELHSQSE